MGERIDWPVAVALVLAVTLGVMTFLAAGGCAAGAEDWSAFPPPSFDAFPAYHPTAPGPITIPPTGCTEFG